MFQMLRKVFETWASIVTVAVSKQGKFWIPFTFRQTEIMQDCAFGRYIYRIRGISDVTIFGGNSYFFMPLWTYEGFMLQCVIASHCLTKSFLNNMKEFYHKAKNISITAGGKQRLILTSLLNTF